MRKFLSSLLASLFFITGALASQNTNVMPLVGPLTMAQVMVILNAGLNTIDSNYSGSVAPAVGPGATPVQYQFWVDTSTTPTTLRMYDGASWVAVGTLDTTAHAYISKVGANLTALAGLTTAANQITIWTGAGAASQATITAYAQTLIAAANASAARTVLGEGTISPKNQGISVGDPGNGNVESVNPVQTNTVAGGACTTSCTFAAGDLYKKTRRSNSGTAMTDTFPASGASGLANGTKIGVTNIDSTATDTITAGAGTTIGGLSTFALGHGQDVWFIYDLSNTAWRLDGNSALVIGSTVEAWNTNLDCLAANAATGLYIFTGSGTCAARTLTGTAAQITVTNGSGASGNPTISLPNAITLPTSAAPATPAAGNISIWADSADTTLHIKNSAGQIETMVLPITNVAHNFLTAIGSNGGVSSAIPVIADISNWGTGVATALGTNVGTAGAFVVNGGAGGTPSSLTLTNATALPVTALTGTTLPSSVVTSSLTTLGVIGVGTWQGTTVALGFGGSGQTTALAARGVSGFNIDGATSTGDANYTILSTDRTVYHTALSAARTDTLPAASSVNVGQEFKVTDFRGVAGATNTVTLARAGADTINGVTSVVAINTQYGAGIYWSDGVSRWTFFPASTGGGSGTVTQTVCNGVTITITGTCPSNFYPTNCTLTSSVVSNILTVALKDNSGADPTASSPCYVPFRSATATTGSTTFVAITAAMSITTNAVGATLGTQSATAFRIWVTMFYNGGTPVLALYSALSTLSCSGINEGLVQSSLGISGTATLAQTYYTPNATGTVTNSPIKIMGYVEYNATGLATAGTYATAPNFVQTFGPGIKEPCQPVKSVYGQQTSTQTVSGTTLFSGLSLSITPDSAANLIKGVIAGDMSATNSGATAFAGALGVSRGACSSAITTAPIGSVAVLTGGVSGNNAYGTGSVFMIDRPNVNSAQAYNVCLWGTNAATSISWPQNPGSLTNQIGTFELTEIQG